MIFKSSVVAVVRGFLRELRGFVSPAQLRVISIRNALARGGVRARSVDERNLC